MPFAGYPDFAACVADNQDKADPEGYCGELERRTTGAAMSTHVALIAPEEILTSDRRLFRAGSWNWRETIPLQFTDTTTEGHDGALHVGNASNLRRAIVGGETWIVGDVAYDDDDDAREARRLADEGKIAGLSADYSGNDFEVIFGEREDGLDSELHYSDAEILGVTQLPMPAFAGARIVTRAEFDGLTSESLVAAANPKAKADWFTDPQLPAPTPLTVTDEGRVYGHLATWGSCHIGFDGVCVTPPESKSEYAYFNLGAVKIDGEEIPCGHITLGTGHATLSADLQSATEHYDNTGSCVADVVAGEDDHGVWISGAVRLGADIDTLRAASLSGDWRRVNGHLELVAALAVNVPGFPIPRLAASVAQGDQLSLVASGVVEHRDREDLIYEALRLMGGHIAEMRSALIGEQEPIRLVSDGETVTDLNTGETHPDETDMKGRIAALLDSSTN